MENSLRKKVPYHGAGPVINGVRKLIEESPVGGHRLMSGGALIATSFFSCKVEQFNFGIAV